VLCCIFSYSQVLNLRVFIDARKDEWTIAGKRDVLYKKKFLFSRVHFSSSFCFFIHITLPDWCWMDDVSNPHELQIVSMMYLFFKCRRLIVKRIFLQVYAGLCFEIETIFLYTLPLLRCQKKKNNEKIEVQFVSYSSISFCYADTDKKIPYTCSHFFHISYSIWLKRKANYLHDDCLSFITIRFGSIFTKIQMWLSREDYYYNTIKTKNYSICMWHM
jgi:hypothetical protein